MALGGNLFEAAAGEAAKPAPITAPVPTAAETMKSRRDTRLHPKGFDSAIFASIPHVPLDGIGRGPRRHPKTRKWPWRLRRFSDDSDA